MFVAQLATVQTAQPRHSHNAYERILVLELAGSMDNKRPGGAQPLAHCHLFHVIHAVIVEQTYAVVLSEQLVWLIDPEEESVATEKMF